MVFRIIFLIFFTFALVSAQHISHFILPSDTDSIISRFNSPHFVVVNNNKVSLSRKNLVVFLPGTNSYSYAYRYFAWAASDLGYHVINLSYPNDKSINKPCADVVDKACHEKIRKEIITGHNYSELIDIPLHESIESRLIHLLQFLSLYFPEDSWGQYLDSTARPRWESIILAGHSQGGGHCAMIGKMYPVYRVIMFSSADFVQYRNSIPAAWLSKPGKTDARRYYAMGHVFDKTFPLEVQQNAWKALRLYTTGKESVIDTVKSPYRNSHILLTAVNPAHEAPCGTPFHNSVIADSETPKDENDNPLFLPAWQYLLSEQKKSLLPQKHGIGSILR